MGCRIAEYVELVDGVALIISRIPLPLPRSIGDGNTHVSQKGAIGRCTSCRSTGLVGA